MKKIIATFFLLMFATFTVAQNIPVTFRVDMGLQVWKGNFNPATQQVVVRGNFQQAAGDPGGNWQGNFFVLSDPDGDTIFTRTVNMPANTAGQTFEFKFVIAPDGWESGNNRTFTVTAPSTVLPVYWFNNDSIYAQQVTNTFNFTADITGILGVGVGGAFDPNQDSLLVMGMTWNGVGNVIGGNRRMVNVNPFNPGIYTTSLTVTGTQGATEKFKFKAFPDARFSNGGWETGDDRTVQFGANNATINLPTIVPRITPLFPPIANNVNVQITVDMTGARNRYNNQLIPLNQIQFVGIRGGADFLGSWNAGGCWCPDDTVGGLRMKVLSPIGNNRYRINTVAPAGTNGGLYEYKFGVKYPGADTVNGGSNYMDNEGPFGVNHRFTLFNAPGGLIVLNNLFGDFTSSIDRISDVIPAQFELFQNYPNPFNPLTNIRYNLPKESFVTLKIYNSLGQEIVTLVEDFQQPGSYEVKFAAPNLASGMYFYKLEADGVSLTKKMILMK
ncbi:MAG: T9SS type A sorting domain-containing protein [Ignavibacterium sp.]|nr:T9SS type A sorting domain-containing protein [Ignavibacterium sp.]MDW8375086.1 T9SS type A sorting domain-containing protein [Ignavibacteriales bacterium]